MGVKSYRTKDGRTLWRVDTWLKRPGGGRTRFREGKIPTKEQAQKLEKQVQVASFQDKWFGRPKTLTVAGAWKSYEPATRAHNRSWQADVGRAKHLVELLGDLQVGELTQRHVDKYLIDRAAESSRRGAPPAQTTLFKEVMLLKRMLNYAVRAGDLVTSPFDRIIVAKVDNVRQRALSEVDFGRLLVKADSWFRLPLLLAYDCGMRRGEILQLEWSMIDPKAKMARLPDLIVKTGFARTVPLTDRTAAALQETPRSLSGFVITNPKTNTRRVDFKKAFAKACSAAKIEGLWFHDLRRSFVTNARRRGVEASVVMKITGHKTQSMLTRYDVVDGTDIQAAARRVEKGRDAEIAEVEHCAESEG